MNDDNDIILISCTLFASIRAQFLFLFAPFLASVHLPVSFFLSDFVCTTLFRFTVLSPERHIS